MLTRSSIPNSKRPAANTDWFKESFVQKAASCNQLNDSSQGSNPQSSANCPVAHAANRSSANCHTANRNYANCHTTNRSSANCPVAHAANRSSANCHTANRNSANCHTATINSANHHTANRCVFTSSHCNHSLWLLPAAPLMTLLTAGCCLLSLEDNTYTCVQKAMMVEH